MSWEYSDTALGSYKRAPGAGYGRRMEPPPVHGGRCVQVADTTITVVLLRGIDPDRGPDYPVY